MKLYLIIINWIIFLIGLLIGILLMKKLCNNNIEKLKNEQNLEFDNANL